MVLAIGSSSCSKEPESAVAAAPTSVSQALATSRRLTVSVRNSETGIGIPAQMVLTASDGTASVLGVHNVASDRRAEIAVPQGKALVRITSQGHLPMDTYIAAGLLLPSTFLLDPETPAPELAPEVVAAQIRAGFAMLHGHVVHAEAGIPIRGARVTLRNAGLSAETDARGYFVLHAPIAPLGEHQLPPTDNLVVERPGFKAYTVERSFLTAGATHFQVDLEPGAGAVARDDTHKILAFEEGQLPEMPPVPEEPTGEAGILASCHDNVRLGTSCSCTTCSSVVTLTRKTYAKRGLNDEWIASWNADSLRAGSVAYRSYGCWYTLNPLRSNYDICSSTCCQANDSDTHSGTDNAVEFTTGEVLAKNGATFRSEYAAENNNGACANGEVGDPANNWPCMNDTVCSGTTFNGHGRGMCQWGSQRHAVNGKSYTWILNHYYNNNGNPAGARSANITSL